MRKRIKIKAKRITAGALAFMMAAGSIPAAGLQAFAKEEEDYNLDNGYLRVEVSEENGGFYISTVKGDKINKDDNNKNLLFHDNGDDTSFTSFQVTRGENTEEYIFGADYEGSSEVKLSKENGEIRAVWSVDDIEFTQTISLVKSGSGQESLWTPHLDIRIMPTTISAVIPSLNRKQHWVRMDITNPFMDIMIRFPQPLLPIL